MHSDTKKKVEVLGRWSYAKGRQDLAASILAGYRNTGKMPELPETLRFYLESIAAEPMPSLLEAVEGVEVPT